MVWLVFTSLDWTFLAQLKSSVVECETCATLASRSPCRICADPGRDADYSVLSWWDMAHLRHRLRLLVQALESAAPRREEQLQPA